VGSTYIRLLAIYSHVTVPDITKIGWHSEK